MGQAPRLSVFCILQCHTLSYYTKSYPTILYNVIICNTILSQYKTNLTFLGFYVRRNARKLPRVSIKTQQPPAYESVGLSWSGTLQGGEINTWLINEGMQCTLFNEFLTFRTVFRNNWNKNKIVFRNFPKKMAFYIYKMLIEILLLSQIVHWPWFLDCWSQVFVCCGSVCQL